MYTVGHQTLFSQRFGLCQVKHQSEVGMYILLEVHFDVDTINFIVSFLDILCQYSFKKTFSLTLQDIELQTTPKTQ